LDPRQSSIRRSAHICRPQSPCTEPWSRSPRSVPVLEGVGAQRPCCKGHVSNAASNRSLQACPANVPIPCQQNRFRSEVNPDAFKLRISSALRCNATRDSRTRYVELATRGPEDLGTVAFDDRRWPICPWCRIAFPRSSSPEANQLR
jgi:hypothetical protein